MMWKKLFRDRNGKLTSDCWKRIENESKVAACFLLINKESRAEMFLNFSTFINHANGMRDYTHYMVILYPLEY